MIFSEFERLHYRNTILREIFRSFFLGLFTALAAICLAFAIDYSTPGQFVIPFGILGSVLLGCLVFLFGAFLGLRKIQTS